MDKVVYLLSVVFTVSKVMYSHESMIKNKIREQPRERGKDVYKERENVCVCNGEIGKS